jgi:RsiW-degrading membrane proteinase PrsW (M82 family)
MVDSTKMFVIGLVVAVVYFLLKFMEMRFVDPENQKPVKVLIRDCIMVCISTVIGLFVLNQFENIGSSSASSSSGAGGGAAAVFTDTPGF